MNKTMEQIVQIMVKDGLAFDDAVEVVVKNRPQPKQQKIIISRPDWSGVGKCIRHDPS